MAQEKLPSQESTYQLLLKGYKRKLHQEDVLNLCESLLKHGLYTNHIGGRLVTLEFRDRRGLDYQKILSTVLQSGNFVLLDSKVGTKSIEGFTVA